MSQTQGQNPTLEFYVQRLELTFTSSNNEQRKLAEDQLLIACCQYQDSLDYIISIVCEAQHNEMIREAAAVICSTVIKKLITSPTPYNLELQMKHTDLFVSCIKNPNLNLKLRGHISTALGHVQSSSRRTNDGKNPIQVSLMNHCKELLTSQDFQLIQSGVFIFQSLISSFENLHLIDKPNFQMDWIQAFLSLGTQVVGRLVALQKQTTSGTQQETQQLVQLLNQWMNSANDFCKKIYRARNQMKEVMLRYQNILNSSEQFNQSLIQALWYIPSDSTTKYFISSTGNVLFDQTVNQTKGAALTCFNYILNTLTNDRTKSEMKRSPFFASLYQLLPNMIMSLLGTMVSVDFSLSEALKNGAISNILTQSLKFISECGQISDFYATMWDSKTAILVDVLLPLLQTSGSEYDMMISEPEEFVNLALDTVDKQSSDIPKTAAASLLETFCDHVDGCTTFFGQLCILIIKHSILSIQHGQDVFSDDTNNPFYLLKDIKNRFFFIKMSPVQRIDSCLMSLTVMSYLLSRRPDLIQLIENLLQNNLAFFQNPQLPPVLIVRLCLFLGYYSDNLFKAENTTSNLIQYILILINFLQVRGQEYSQVCMYQAVDSLKNICEDDELTEKVRTIIPSLMPPLSNGLLESMYEPHFDMIQNILKLFAKTIYQQPELLAGTLEILVTRINLEQSLVQQGQKDRQIWINKSWNIIRSLPEVDEYVPSCINIIESKIQPLFKMLEEPELIEFDEDIILLVSAMIEKAKAVTPLQMSLLYYGSKLIEKQKYRMGQMFEMLNNFLYFGKNLFLDVNHQKKLFEIAFKSMQPEVNSLDHLREAEQGEGVLLLQLAIQILKNQLNVDLLKAAFQQVLSMSSRNLKNDFLKSRLFGVFLSAFLFDPERTNTILQEQGILQQIFDRIIENYWLCQEGYDTRLYIYSITNIIMSSPQVFSIQALDSMITLLDQQQKGEYKKAQRQEKARRNNWNNDDQQGFSDDDNYEDFEDDSDSVFDETKQEAIMSLESFRSDLKKVDEFDQFRTFIDFFKNKHPQIIDQIRVELPKNKFDVFQVLRQMVRVPSEQGNEPPRKIITVPTRRKNRPN